MKKLELKLGVGKMREELVRACAITHRTPHLHPTFTPPKINHILIKLIAIDIS
jgi:hypothetical protein